MSNHTVASYLNSESGDRDFGFQSIIRNSNSDDHSMSLLDWFDRQEVVSLHGTEHGKSGQSTTITFGLAGLAAPYFPILRGLIALGQPRTFGVEVDTKTRSFSLRLEEDQEAEVKNYLKPLFVLIKSEVRFKQVLRKVLLNQEKFEREEKLLYRSL